MVSRAQKMPGQLVTIAAGESGLDQMATSLSMARAAARAGGSVLLIDCGDDDLTQSLDVSIKASLHDVITGDASLRDAKTIDQETGLIIASAGPAELSSLLGPLAAMSLSYDWVFVILPSGCTPAHVRLMGAAEHSVLMFDSRSDRFMRAYWMLDAIRARAPRCDPMMVGRGTLSDVNETYGLFAQTVREFLGAPPSLVGVQVPNACMDTMGMHIFGAMAPKVQRLRA